MWIVALPLALANGQTSHQWITVAAISHVPPGPLRDLLEREDLRGALLNGTMFPDGGYAIDHGYGELSHWEPTQDRYLAWIRARCEAPFDDACAQHVAFFLGMRSHGMADQHYDAVYMERSRAVDTVGWSNGKSMDEATDVAMAAAVGPGVVPDPWIPLDPLLSVFEDVGAPVGEAELGRAQDLLGVAITAVGGLADSDVILATYEASFPWACAHQIDPEVVGNPPHEAAVVARYWEVAWDRLSGGDGWERPVIATYPEDGGYGAPAAGLVRDADDTESRLQVVFARGLDEATVGDASFDVRDASGAPVAVSARLFYGRASHVVTLAPVEDWAADAEYSVTVLPGIRTFDGLEMDAPVSFSFHTGAAAPPSADDPVGCASAPGPGWLAVAAAAAAARRRGQRTQIAPARA
jgi:hypothetical protein